MVQPSISRMKSVMDLCCCLLLLANPVSKCPELPFFACACLSSSRRCSQLQHLPMFLLKKWPSRLLLLWKLKSDPDPFFHKILTPVQGPKKCRILPESTPQSWPSLVSINSILFHHNKYHYRNFKVVESPLIVQNFLIGT